MSGSFRHVWEYTGVEIWEQLTEYTTKDSAGNDVSAPDDLFSDLFEVVDEYLAISTPEAALEEIANDPVKARASFLNLKGTDFSSESSIVIFLEKARYIIADYDIPGYEPLYKRLLRDLLRKYNLRYRLDEPFNLRFLLPGSFSNLYAELHRVNSTNAHLAGLLADFEYAFDRYARTQDPTDLKTCIAKASNYAEGLASFTHGAPGTLGFLCDQLGDWPHDKVKEALKSLYKFCSDYPGIRHAGNPAGVRRILATRDLTLGCLLMLSFSGYLSTSVDEQVVLGI